MRLMIWTIGDPDGTEHLGPAVGALRLPFRGWPRLIWKDVQQ